MRNPKLAEVYRRAEELVTIGHCKLTNARDWLQRPCWALSPDAKSWCIQGAIMRAVHDMNPEKFDYDLFKAALNRSYGSKSLADWNDSVSQRTVIESLRNARWNA